MDSKERLGSIDCDLAAEMETLQLDRAVGEVPSYRGIAVVA